MADVDYFWQRFAHIVRSNEWSRRQWYNVLHPSFLGMSTNDIVYFFGDLNVFCPDDFFEASQIRADNRREVKAGTNAVIFSGSVADTQLGTEKRTVANTGTVIRTNIVTLTDIGTESDSYSYSLSETDVSVAKLEYKAEAKADNMTPSDLVTLTDIGTDSDSDSYGYGDNYDNGTNFHTEIKVERSTKSKDAVGKYVNGNGTSPADVRSKATTVKSLAHPIQDKLFYISPEVDRDLFDFVKYGGLSGFLSTQSKDLFIHNPLERYFYYRKLDQIKHFLGAIATDPISINIYRTKFNQGKSVEEVKIFGGFMKHLSTTINSWYAENLKISSTGLFQWPINEYLKARNQREKNNALRLMNYFDKGVHLEQVKRNTKIISL